MGAAAIRNLIQPSKTVDTVVSWRVARRPCPPHCPLCVLLQRGIMPSLHQLRSRSHTLATHTVRNQHGVHLGMVAPSSAELAATACIRRYIAKWTGDLLE